MSGLRLTSEAHNEDFEERLRRNTVDNMMRNILFLLDGDDPYHSVSFCLDTDRNDLRAALHELLKIDLDRHDFDQFCSKVNALIKEAWMSAVSVGLIKPNGIPVKVTRMLVDSVRERLDVLSELSDECDLDWIEGSEALIERRAELSKRADELILEYRNQIIGVPLDASRPSMTANELSESMRILHNQIHDLEAGFDALDYEPKDCTQQDVGERDHFEELYGAHERMQQLGIDSDKTVWDY